MVVKNCLLPKSFALLPYRHTRHRRSLRNDINARCMRELRDLPKKTLTFILRDSMFDSPAVHSINGEHLPLKKGTSDVRMVVVGGGW